MADRADPATGYEEAQRRIAAAKQDGATELTFSQLLLTAVPPEIASLTTLRTLNLHGNQLTTLPPEIASLTALQALDLSSNQLATLPPEIGSLTALQSLDLRNNRLATLPRDIGQLLELRVLNLMGNALGIVPKELTTLTALQHLDLALNQLASLPPEIGSLKELLSISLHGNRLKSVPSEIGLLRKLERIHLDTNKPLTALPPELGELASLAVLYLHNNSLTALPTTFGSLKCLKELTLSLNCLATFPPEIVSLTALETLSINSNQLTTLPAEIGSLIHLQSLDLQDNKLTTLPPAIGSLAALQTLSLGGNHLTTLPPAIGSLTALQTLSLGGNNLTTLPSAIGSLTALQTLSLGGNHLTRLPPEIGSLTALQTLALNGNELTTLPPEVRNLESLRALFLQGNESLRLPPEVLGPESLQTKGYGGDKEPANPADILAFYFANISSGERRALNEVKVILVGQGGVGKTSLVKRIVYDKFNKREKKTEGIYIDKEWKVDGKRKGKQVQVNFWDFGGQEIMHATHQFFLTKRTIYLLVLDARKGENESNIHYWLKVIRSFGGDSPVLVVTNKCETHHMDLNQTRLKKDYPSIKGFFNTSCEEKTGIAKLKKAIQKQVLSKGMKHVFDPLRKVFFDVKEELEALAKQESYIDIRKYYALCATHSVSGREEQDVLLRFLHDLGSVLSFNDPESPYALREMSVLQPQWVTTGVYKILNDTTLKKKQRGMLSRGALKRILDGSKHPPSCWMYIMDMMGKFELSFASEEGKRWLVAELLPANEPSKLPTEGPALNFEYRYEVLPPGIICRFIVRRARNLGKKPIYWRSGAVLEFENSLAVVRSDPDEGRMHITVRGRDSERKATLAIIRDEFGKIHQTIPNLNPTEWVPLPDDPTVVVPYAHLKTLADQKVIDFIPEGTTKRYTVRELLDGIQPPWGGIGLHLYPPFFGVEPQTSFADAWEVFCCDVLNRHEKTTHIRRRTAPDAGIDLIWQEKSIAYQCKSVESGKTGDFDVTKALESFEAAKKSQAKIPWKQYIICTNVELTGSQETKICEQCSEVDVRFLTPSFWIPRCHEQWHEVGGRFRITPRTISSSAR